MTLTITPARYAEIRRRVKERRAIRKAEEALSQMEETPLKAFATVDSFMQHLDTLVADSKNRRPQRSRKKAR